MKSKVTKKEIKEYVKQQLGTSDVWAKKALLKILENQTKDEILSESTHEHNGIGFTGSDAEILTSFAKQYQKNGTLSQKQINILLKKMPKYSVQIINVSDKEKLEKLIIG
jgi:hypothetical protein